MIYLAVIHEKLWLALLCVAQYDYKVTKLWNKQLFEGFMLHLHSFLLQKKINQKLDELITGLMEIRGSGLKSAVRC